MAHVLIIEPDKLLAQTYRRALEHAGCSVAVAHGAQDGVQASDIQKPDVVVLELQLAAHDGIEFLHEFRSYAEWRAVPVIVQSSIPPEALEPFVLALKRDLGVVELLYKTTASLRLLVRAVREALKPAATEGLSR